MSSFPRAFFTGGFLLMALASAQAVLPEIKSFKAEPNLISPASSTFLKWNVDGEPNLISISPEIGDVTDLITVEVSPTATTTYTLTASNDDGVVTSEATVTISPNPTGLRINELLARSISTGELDENGEDQDWLELYNPTGTAIALSGYFLTDDEMEPDKWAIPAVTLEADSYLRVFASGENRTGDALNFHTNFTLSGGGEYLAITQSNGAGFDVIHELAPGYPSQTPGISYGYNSTGTRLGFFSSATPGSLNPEPASGFVADTNFNIDRGFQAAPFQLEITSDTPGAEIRYTTDGEEPTQLRGNLYEGPIEVTESSIIRAAAYKDGLIATNVDTQTYLFDDDIWNQFERGRVTRWPRTTATTGQVFNYGMDRDVTGVVGQEKMTEALKAIPTLSLVTARTNLLSTSTGIYVNPGNRGRAWEREGSLELVNPDGSRGFQVNCGIRMRGGASRSLVNPKHSFRLFFRDDYGERSLNFPIFGTEGADRFRKLDLRTAQNYSWSFRGDVVQGLQNTFLREVLARDLQSQFDVPYTRSRYYHLYLNGIYWGLFMTQERAERHFSASYLGGDDDDYDVLKSTGNSEGYLTEATDGSLSQGDETTPASAWAMLSELTKAQLASPTSERYLALQGLNPDGTRNPALPVLLEMDQLIFYKMLMGYTGNFDGPLSNFVQASNNWYAIRNFRTNDRGFAFLMHDAEHSLGANADGRWDRANDRINTNDGLSQRNLYNRYNPEFVHQDLADSTPEYRRRFGDLAHNAIFNEQILARNGVMETLARRKSIVSSVIDAESARWGDSKRRNPLLRADWNLAVSQVERIISQRTENFLDHLKVGNLYPSLTAPRFDTDERRIPSGNPVRLYNETGTLYYTIDGSDPRGNNNQPSTGALTTDGNVSLVTLMESDTTWRFLDTGEDLGSSAIIAGTEGYDFTNWKHPDFNDAAWSSGAAPLGFGPVSGLAFNTNIAQNNQVTTYLRTTFDYTPEDDFVGLQMKYRLNDGFIVYLNGLEVFRKNMTEAEDVDFRRRASSGEAAENRLFTRKLYLDSLRPGLNSLAVELHNESSLNTDLGISVRIEALKLNPATTAIPINGAMEIYSRSFDSTTSTWSALNAGLFTSGLAPTSSNLIISEVDYHPRMMNAAELADVRDFSESDFEFIEITNLATSPLDLGGAALGLRVQGNDLEGVTFNFPAGATIGARETILIVGDLEAFQLRYPTIPSEQIFGEFSGNLSNNREWIVINNDQGEEIAAFRYDDKLPWPAASDGEGSTLQLEALSPSPDYSNPARWTAGSSPGSVPSTEAFTGDPLADLDGDGSPAIMEYLAGTSDSDAREFDTPTAGTMTINGEVVPTFSFQVKPGRIDALPIIEISDGLESFQTANLIPMGSVPGTNGAFIQYYRRASQDTELERGFFRLRVIAQ